MALFTNLKLAVRRPIVSALATALAAIAAPPDARGGIPAGDDCFRTECGGGTEFNFCDSAIPAGFFGPGSDPFTGSVEMGGNAEPGTPDTVAHRLQAMEFGPLPAHGFTPIELVQLNLASCNPITVTFNGGRNAQQWDVGATLSEAAPGLGTMTVTKTHDNGGTFEAEFPVQPVFTFTRAGDPRDVRVLDTGSENLPPLSLSTRDGTWVHQVKFASADPCGQDFFVPGVKEDPATGGQCCVPVCHLANVPAHHCVVVDLECPCCPTGACCGPADGSCTVEQGSPDPDGPCPEDACAAKGGSYMGDNTDCSDGDGDGLADATEAGGSGDCCSFDPNNLCKIGTDPGNADSDGDGCSDGGEARAGTDPCDPCDCGAPPPGTDCCPDDPDKTDPGACGCGEPDTDADADGVADCLDGCPDDPNKTAAGVCGCGTPETDTDSDGTADCNDGCPLDPAKTAPGACGCGEPDADSDGDGVADCADNCPDKANPDQADADGDGAGDACGATAPPPGPRACGFGFGGISLPFALGWLCLARGRRRWGV